MLENNRLISTLTHILKNPTKDNSTLPPERGISKMVYSRKFKGGMVATRITIVFEHALMLSVCELN